MVRPLVHKLAKWYVNWRGWHTDRKILVIESDDWGTVRMPSREAFQSLANSNSLIEQDAFSRLDHLATTTDLSDLFDVLTSFKDQHGRHPAITANTIVANPDFAKIEASDFQTYHYEPFHETILRQPNGKQVLDLWEEGRCKKIFCPQLHGREHLHVPAWLKLLREDNKDLRAAFEWQCFGVPYRSDSTNNKRRNLLAAFDHLDIAGEEEFQAGAVEDAAAIFEDYFGYRSQTLIAPAYIWHPRLEQAIKKEDIRFLQGLSLYYMPRRNAYQKQLRFTGQVSKAGLVQLVRNCFFEPAPKPQWDWGTTALSQIEAAFAAKKPAILSTHRINFIGRLDESNRTTNLKLFAELLQNIIARWPSVEFLTSPELAGLIDRGI